MTKYSPFIYEPERSIEVLKKTEIFFQDNPSIIQKISNLGWVYQSIGKTIPHTTENFWSGHFFPYVESTQEFQISFNLVLFGLYKQAFMSLRSGLEVGMLSVYYNINDEGHKTVQDWLRSKDTWEANTPRIEKIWKILNTNNNIADFNDRFNLRKRFDDLSFLHNYIHTKGYKYSNQLGVPKSNFQTFEENVLKKWVDTYEEVIIIVATLHMLKYPISVIEFDWNKKVGIDNPYPVLEVFEINKIKNLLPDDFIAEIQKIAKTDEFTQGLYKHIVELPDMSEEEKEQQMVEFDKSTIEHGQGFLEWEKQQLEWMKSYSEKEKEKILTRIKLLNKWAIENNMMKPKLERLKEEGFFKKVKSHNNAN
ncbi:MAG: hypothetical protein ABIL58_10445 [Pseudomonadota bacterium]